MKTYLYQILLLLLVFLDIKAQVFYTKKTIADENLTFSLEDKFSDIISCGNIYDSNFPNKYKGILYKLSSTGNLKIKKQIEFGDDMVLLTYCKEVDNGYLFFGSRKLNNGNNFPFILKTNYNFDLVIEKNIGTGTEFDNVIHDAIIKDEDTIIVVANNIVSFSPNLIWNATIYKLDLNLNVIESKTFIVPGLNSSNVLMSIIQFKNNEGYKVSSRNDLLGLQDNSNGGVFICNLDNNFNVISSKYYKKFIPNYELNHITEWVGDLHRLNDSIYVMGVQGNYWQPPITFITPGKDVVALYLNEQNDSLLYYHITGNKDTNDYASLINISIINDTTLYGTATHNMQNGSIYGKEVTWLMVNKQKYTFNGVTQNWEYFYGGDARYLLSHVLTLKDGGCLITAQRYDTSGVYLSDVFFLKIQEDGTPYPVGGINKTKKSVTITISPNPVSDIITAVFPENTYKEIGLINMQGETIFKQELKSNLSQFKIDCNSYTAGAYSVYFKEKETGFGIAKKIIIQH